MEQKQVSSENFFFNKIMGNLGNFDEAKMSNFLDAAINDINNLGKVSTESFELLGSIAYMVGLDFTSQRESYNVDVLKNINTRMTECKVSKDNFNKFIEVVKLLSFEMLEEPKETMKERVNKAIPVTVDTIPTKLAIANIFKNSLIPVKFLIEVDKLIKAKSLTYHNLLQFNSMVYEQLGLKGMSMTIVIELLHNTYLTSNMAKAADFFDDGKYAIIYLDSIMSVKEYHSVNAFTADVVFDVDNFETLASTPLVLTIAEETTEFEAPLYEPEDTDMFIRSLFEDCIKKPVSEPADVLEAIDIMMQDDDLVQRVYKFLKSQYHVNRKSVEEVFGFSNESLLAAINSKVTSLGLEYKTLAEEYMQDIPAEHLQKIVSQINETIKALVVEDKEVKGHFFQQFMENQVFTYKQLHQTIGLIEDCMIDGSKLSTYINLRDTLMYDENISNVFENSIKTNKISLEHQFYYGVATFYTEQVAD